MEKTLQSNIAYFMFSIFFIFIFILTYLILGKGIDRIRNKHIITSQIDQLIEEKNELELKKKTNQKEYIINLLEKKVSNDQNLNDIKLKKNNLIKLKKKIKIKNDEIKKLKYHLTNYNQG